MAILIVNYFYNIENIRGKMKYLSRPEELVLICLWKMTDDPYGLNIKKMLEDLTGKYWSIGSVYVPLDRLENKGYVKSYLTSPTSEKGGKSKRFYEITKSGISQLKEVKKIYETFWKDIPDLG